MCRLSFRRSLAGPRDSGARHDSQRGFCRRQAKFIIYIRFSKVPLLAGFPGTFTVSRTSEASLLIRCDYLSQYETLRVYPVVLPIGRITSSEQRITIPQDDTSTSSVASRHILPPQCGVIVNNTGVHYNPQYWPSPHILSPSRWLAPNVNTHDPTYESSEINGPTKGGGVESPRTVEVQGRTFSPRHERGTFLTFSEGPRACLGKRFAVAEFVAFFSSVLKRHRLVLGDGVRKVEVERLYRLRSAGSPITLAPPGDVELKLVQR